VKREFSTAGGFQELVFNGLLDPEFTIYTDEAWFR
jgi:hypothetical protein